MSNADTKDMPYKVRRNLRVPKNLSMTAPEWAEIDACAQSAGMTRSMYFWLCHKYFQQQGRVDMGLILKRLEV